MLASLIGFSKYFKSHNVSISNFTFQLIAKLNFTLFICLVAIFSAKTYFGEPINCTGASSVCGKLTNDYCWLMGVYIQPGFVGTLVENASDHGFGFAIYNSPKTYLRYYQWMVFVYFFMGISYLLPLFLWKTYEGGLIRGLCDKIQGPIHAEFWTHEKRSALLLYFTHARRNKKHRNIALKFSLVKVLNVAICLLNILVVEVMFDGFWERYLPAISALYQSDYYNWTVATAKIFPRVAKCEFYNIGASGTMQRHDLMCLLPLNIINEKVFAFLYFWLALATVIATIDLLSGIVVLCFRQYRIKKLAQLTYDGNYRLVKCATDNGDLGDFFILNLIAKNVSSYVFNDLILGLAGINRKNSIPDPENDLKCV